MISLWEESQFWRILINCIGAISIVIGVWLIVKILRSFILGKNQKKNLQKQYVDLKQLPSVFKDIVQIAFEVNNPQEVKISILDQSENLITLVYDELSDHGLHVENFDSKKMKDGNYHLELITPNQRILRKIVIKN